MPMMSAVELYCSGAANRSKPLRSQYRKACPSRSEIRRPIVGKPLSYRYVAGGRDREFVTAHPRNYVRVSDHSDKALGDNLQKQISGGMSHAIIDRLEPV